VFVEHASAIPQFNQTILTIWTFIAMGDSDMTETDKKINRG
jgi:hypothetical protein